MLPGLTVSGDCTSPDANKGFRVRRFGVLGVWVLRLLRFRESRMGDEQKWVLRLRVFVCLDFRFYSSGCQGVSRVSFKHLYAFNVSRWAV